MTPTKFIIAAIVAVIVFFSSGCNSQDSGTAALSGDVNSCSGVGIEEVANSGLELDCTETPVTLEGTIEVQSALAESGGEAILYILEASDGHRYQLTFTSSPDGLATGDHVRVTGTTLTCATDSSTRLVFVDGFEKLDAKLETAALSNVAGEQKTAVVLVSFSDSATTYTSATSADVVFNKVNNFWLENSFGQTWVTGQTFGPYTISLSKSGCDTDAIETQAKAAAAAAGVDLSAYRRQLFIFPKNGCSWLGLGTIGGSPSKAWVNGSFVLHTVAHEMGHNLGLYHANSSNCGSASIGSSCTTSEYGDTADVMGNYLAGHYNAFQKERLGWIAPQLTTASGSYTLSPYESAGGTKALKILKSGSTYYYVEFRQPTGFDSVLAGSSTYNLTTGVLVHTGSTTNGNTSLLLNMNPSQSSFYKAALTAGQSFQDTAAGVKITLTSASASGATVNVEFSTSTPNPTPTPTPTPGTTLAVSIPIASNSLTLGQTLSVPVQVTKNGSALSGASYTMTITGPGGESISRAGVTGSSGRAVQNYVITSCARTGTYSLRVDANDGSTSNAATTSFSVL